MRVAIGLKSRIGRAALVIVGGEATTPVFVESREIKLLPEGDWAPYHAADELPKAKQHAAVERAIATAHRLAEEAIRDAAARSRAAGHEPVGCGVLVGKGMPKWTTDEILAVHVRMHVAEGELFREVLVAGARANHLALATLPDKSPLESAAKALGMKGAQLDASLAALGKAAGPPWRKEQKEAAAAALVVLAGAKRQS
jgi:hypothetical protein